MNTELSATRAAHRAALDVDENESASLVLSALADSYEEEGYTAHTEALRLILQYNRTPLRYVFQCGDKACVLWGRRLAGLPDLKEKNVV